MLAMLAMSLMGCDDPARDAALDEEAPIEGALRAWPQLRQGDRGEDVLAAQTLLRARGQTTRGDGDADFAAGTAAAVRGFQRANGLAVDGVIGPITWEALISDVRLGSASPSVAAAQRLLMVRAGAVIDGDEREDERDDARAGASTILAVEQLQAERCLIVSGAAGVYTWSALLGELSYCDGGPDGVQTLARVAELARAAGVACGEPLAIAVAIASAESGLRGNAINRNGPTAGCAEGSSDVGLWQINDCYHPEIPRACALDAECNGRAMYDVSRRGIDWTPWTTYRNGAYTQFLDGAKRVAALACATRIAAKRSR
jgi:peptidoglycan hydrolase-like protein with peptidoglycan-binding domain